MRKLLTATIPVACFAISGSSRPSAGYFPFKVSFYHGDGSPAVRIYYERNANDALTQMKLEDSDAEALAVCNLDRATCRAKFEGK